MDMYAENILEHYKHPHNYGQLPNRNAEYKEYNPLCGDMVTIYLLIENNRVKDVMFVGKGCAISQSAMSLLTDEIKGKTLDEIKRLDRGFILDLLGVEISPVRLKCATIGIKALKLAVYDYLIKQGKNVKEKEFAVDEGE